jgi:predicted CoA-binding protein
MNKLDTINQIFELKTIAVVGMSPKPERPSHYVAMYLKEKGYTIIPVNPGHKEIAGMTSYPNLESIPEKVEVVNIFRRSEFVPPIVESAMTIGAKAIWMQDHVIHERAAQKAKNAGLLIVMNDCMLRRYRLIWN